MAERPGFIVDASVAGKWYLKDEELTAPALRLFEDFTHGRVGLLAPDHILYEVPSAIRNAVPRARLDPFQARNSISLFLAAEIPTVRSESLVLMGFDEAHRFGCSLYDGLYLALARTSRLPLVHADGRLRRNLGGRFPFELWLEDYSSPPR